MRALTRLKSLTLSRNYLATFPSQITACSSLEHLRLTGNALVKIEPQVGNLTSLQTLEVDLDKITQPPMEVNVQVCSRLNFQPRKSSVLTTYWFTNNHQITTMIKWISDQ